MLDTYVSDNLILYLPSVVFANKIDGSEKYDGYYLINIIISLSQDQVQNVGLSFYKKEDRNLEFSAITSQFKKWKEFSQTEQDVDGFLDSED